MTRPRDTRVSAIVLGGGHSRRFGRDKVTAPWGGSTLLDQVLSAIPRRRHEVLLVLREAQTPLRAAVDRIVLDDPRHEEAPLRGIVAGLRASRDEWNWVLACDLPYLRGEFLELLYDRRGPDVDVVVARRGDRAEPLMALYHRGCLELLQARLERRALGLRNALQELRVRWIEEAEWRRVDPDGQSFRNLNTPECDADDIVTTRPRRRRS